MATWNSQCCRTNNSPLILHVHHKLTAAPLYTLFTLGPRLIEELLSGTLQPVVEGKESKYSVLWLEKLLQRSVPHYLPPSHFMLINPRQDTCPHLTVKCQELAYAPTGKGVQVTMPSLASMEWRYVIFNMKSSKYFDQ